MEVTLDLTDKRIIVYDFETDGFWENNGRNRPIEVALIYIDPDGTIGTYHELIKRRDKSPLPEKITEITGITTEMLAEKGKDIKVVFNNLDEIFNTNPKVVVGHNIIRFDNKFLNFRFNKYGYIQLNDNDCFDTGGQFKAEKLGWPKFDTATYAQYHTAALNKRIRGLKWNLKCACDDYEIPIDMTKQHRADYDVLLTTKVFIEQAIRLGIATDILNILNLDSYEEGF